MTYDVQKWQASINYMYPINDETPQHAGRMVVVLAAEAEAAIEAARQEGADSLREQARMDDWPAQQQDTYERGQRDMLAKCIAAVKAANNPGRWDEFRNHVLNALHALEKP